MGSNYVCFTIHFFLTDIAFICQNKIRITRTFLRNYVCKLITMNTDSGWTGISGCSTPVGIKNKTKLIRCGVFFFFLFRHFALIFH